MKQREVFYSQKGEAVCNPFGWIGNQRFLKSKRFYFDNDGSAPWLPPFISG